MKRLLCLLLMVAALPATAAELTVSAASSLTESFRDIASAYEAAQPGTKVDLNFAASGVLLQQHARRGEVQIDLRSWLRRLVRAGDVTKAFGQAGRGRHGQFGGGGRQRGHHQQQAQQSFHRSGPGGLRR